MESAKRVAKRGVRFCEGNEKERKRETKKKERGGEQKFKKKFRHSCLGAPPPLFQLFFSLSLSLSSFFYFVRVANQREKKRLSGIKTRAYFY